MVVGRQSGRFARVGLAGRRVGRLSQGADGGLHREGGDDENEQSSVDTLGQEIDPNKIQIFVYGVNFPVLFHETIKGIQKVLAGHGQEFPGYDASNPRHVEFVEKVKQYEDVLEHEMWDLRLGPAIWQRYRSVHPTEVLDPDQKIELQGWVQSYIYKLLLLLFRTSFFR